MKKKNSKRNSRSRRLIHKQKKKTAKAKREELKKKEHEKTLFLPSITKDLFKPIVVSSKQADSFRSLFSEGFRPALTMMETCYKEYHDKDGNFIEQFQSTGFDARTWELYLNTYLLGLNFSVSTDHESPDFVVSKGGSHLCIEAVTTSKSLQGKLAGIKNLEKIKEHYDFNAIKAGSALWSKHKKKYWELPHVKGRPLLFALQCFHEDGPLYSGDSPLIDYLYGTSFSWHFDDKNQLVVKQHEKKNHIIKSKEIPSGFFNLAGSENISAIMFNNSGTAAKFNRMGKLKWPKCKVEMIRTGVRYQHDPNATTPSPFEYKVGAERPKERWGEGLIMFHNPNATNPVNKSLFNDIPHGYYKDGSFVVDNMPDFHPLWSITKRSIK